MPPSQSPQQRHAGLARRAEQAVDERSRARGERVEEAGLAAISRSVARPQAVATGLPDSVPAW